MLQYNKMENLKIYNTKINPIVDLKNPRINNLIILNTLNIEDSKNIMSIPNLSLIRFKSYFIDRYYNKLKFFNKPASVKKIDSTEIYKDIKESKENIIRFNKNFEDIKGINTFFDLHVYNKIFFENIGSFHGDRVIEEYMNFLTSLVSRFTEYQNKIMIFDLNNVNLKDKNMYKYIHANTPFTILLNAMKRFPEQFKLLDIDIIVVKGVKSMKIKTAAVTPSYQETVKAKLNILANAKPIDIKKVGEYVDSINSEEPLPKEDVLEIIKSKMDGSFDISKFSFNGDEEISDIIDKKIEKAYEEYSEEIVDDEDLEKVKAKVEEELDADMEFLKKFEVSRTVQLTPSILNTKRNKLLEERQAEIKINNKGLTVAEIIKESKAKEIEPKIMNINTGVEKMKKMVLPNFEKEYNKKLLEKDTVAIINFFKDKSIPVYILDIKKEDTSNEFDKKYTYTIKMESADRQRHTLTFDMPKFVQDSFMYLGGNKKSIVKQLVLKPVSKTGPNTVQICTNYNKIFITRRGNKISPKLERLAKILAEYSTNNGVKIKSGNNASSNVEYKTSMEYDDLGSKYMSIFLFKELNIYFNQHDLRKQLIKENVKFKSSDDLIPIGYEIKNNKKVALHLDTNKDIVIEYNKSLSDLIIEKMSSKINGFKDEMNKMSVGKRFIYSEAKIIKKVPLILLLSSLEGLSTVMRKAGINFEFSDTRRVLTGDDKNNKDIIEFRDGYLIYDRYPMKNSLLMNGISIIPTKEYDFSDMDSNETYLDIFDELINIRMILNAFNNFYDLLIDPITKEVLEDLNLPTGFVELILYANELLEDSAYTKENNMRLYRLRSNEIANAYLYKSLAKAYERYRISASNKNPVKMSIPQDEVMKNIITSPIVEDYSTLNPILESEKKRAVTYKGPSGGNAHYISDIIVNPL